MDHRLFFHRFPQLAITFADRPFGLFGCILADCALRQSHTCQLFHDLRRLPYRDAVNVVKNAGQRFHSRSHPVSGRTLLARRNIGVSAPHRFPALQASPCSHRVPTHLGDQHGWNVSG
jgi:hypothetical protein